LAYEEKERIANVKIEGGDLDGLELVLNLSVSTQDFIDFQRKRFGALATLDTQEEAFSWFGETVLISWNYTRGGEEVPATWEGLRSVDPALMLEVIERWRAAVLEVDGPLVQRSTAGNSPAARSTRTPASPSGRPSRRSGRRS
jgi:hypothetical protein